jgi:hypothetical protein
LLKRNEWSRVGDGEYLLGALVDTLHERGENILAQERVVNLGDQGVKTVVGLLLVGLEETLDVNLNKDLLDGNDVSLLTLTIVLLYIGSLQKI